MLDSRFPLFPSRSATNSISSVDTLAEALNIPLSELKFIKNMSPDSRYKRKEVPKSGGMRVVYDPHPKVRLIQKRINNRIFLKLIDWPEYLYGSLPNTFIKGEVFQRDYIACASKHCLSKSLIKVDISNFFDNIHRDYVFDVFNDLLKLPDEVSDFLTDICCYKNFVVQGALTSSYLALLCFWNLEGELVRKFDRKNLVYTRLVDDITVSSKKHNYNFDYVKHDIQTMLIKLDMPINENKTKVLRDGIMPLQVHGLRVNYARPRLPSGEVKRIRAAVNNVIKLSKINNYRTSLAYRALYDRCIGRINKLSRVGHNKHEVFKKMLLEVKPLPSKRDLISVEKSLSVLESVKRDRLQEKKYTRKYYLAQYRVSIISRTYIYKANSFKKRLSALRPDIGKYER